MKKKTLIAIGLVVSMSASTATAFAGTAGTVSTVDGDNTKVVKTLEVAGAVDGTYAKSPVKGYAVQNENNCMVHVSEDPGVTGSHNGKTYCIIYEDGAKEFVRADKTTFIQSAPEVTKPTESTSNSGNTSSGVTIKDGIAVKNCPSQAEIKAYVKAHPFTDNKINWDVATYSVKPDPEHGVIGKLSVRSEQQYINYCNFARYCAGLPELKLNSDLSNKAMHAAALSYLAYKNGHFEVHNPVTRPSGLTDEQWEIGKKACSESSLVATNGSYKSTTAICQQFLLDTSSEIGHRILNFKETEEMGIGLVNGTGAESPAWLDDNYCNKSSIINDEYIAYPGTNFPVELMQQKGGQIKEGARGMCNFTWSVSLGSDYKVSSPSNLKVVFDHSRYGKQVLNATSGIDSKNAVAYSTKQRVDGPGTVYFTPVFDEDEDSDYRWKSFDIGDKCTVTLTGVEKNGQPATIKYTTTLFSVFGYDPIYKGGNTNVTDPDEDDDNEYVEPERPSISKPAKVTGVKAKAGKKYMTVSWKKAKNASGYQVAYAANKSFKAAKKVTTTKTTAKLKKLKSKKTYYVKVRAYRKANGKTLYGSYSNVVKQKVK